MKNIKPYQNYFIVWIKFQRRALSMQVFFDYQLKFIPEKLSNTKFKFIDYIYKSFSSFWCLFINRPSVLWIQLPPSPLLWVTLIYKLFNKKMIIIADCHNGLFGKKWGKYIKNGKYLNNVDILITHNYIIKDMSIDMGLDSTKIFILEDKPATKPQNIDHNYEINIETPWILMPCGFAEDEPLSVVFEAARLIPDITIVISGNTKRASGFHDLENLPNNVLLTGYLSNENYESLIINADAILGLTTEHHIQISVANEATGFEKPMILSDTPLLRELFNKGATYVNNHDPISMADGIKLAIINKDSLSLEVKTLKKERNKKWQKQAQGVKNEITRLINNKKAIPV